MAAFAFPPDPARVEAIFEIFARINPHPKPELEFKDPYTLLVSVVLSAQATDVSVNKATQKLYAVADKPGKMAALGEAGLIPFISSIGLYRGKAKNVVKLSEIILKEHGGAVPRTRELLEALPGVGRKTANVVLNVAFEELTIAVDTHVFRVSHRLSLADAPNREKVELQLMRVVPERFLSRAHHWLILHGRYTCLARKPLCATCPIFDPCEFKEKKKIAAGTAAGKPAKKKKSVLPKGRRV